MAVCVGALRGADVGNRGMIANARQSDEILEIRLFGAVAITRGGRARPLPASRKTRGLLAYLALAAAPCRRAELCDLLWENVADPRGELRWSLSRIREALGPWLVTSGESVSIAREGLVVDAVTLKHLAEARPAAHSVRQALALWSGEPLADAYVPDCHRYHLWWLAEREALTALHGRLLHASVERAWSSPPEALAAARGLVVRRPFDEMGHLRVARALERVGRTSEANAYLAEMRLALSAELGLPAIDVMSATITEPAIGPGAACRRRAAPPLVYLEPLEILPPEETLAATAASVVVHLAEGLWRSRACEIAEAVGHGREAAAPPAVRFVLRGSIVRLDRGLQVILRCVEARRGLVLWCAQFPPHRRSMDRAVAAIEAAIRCAELEGDADGRLGAHARIVEMVSLANALEPSANRRALHIAKAMLEEDAGEPTSLAVAAWCHAQRAVYNWSPDAGAERREARRFASAATVVGSQDPNCLTSIAAARTLIADHSGAGALLDRALRLNPGSVTAHSRKGWLANYSDQPDLAIRCFRAALRLLPPDRSGFNDLVGLGVAHFIKGEYQPAIRRMEQGLAINPKATWIQRNLVPAYAAAGRHAEAAEALRDLLDEHENLSIAAVENAMVFSPPVMAKISKGLAEAGLQRA